MSNGNCKKCGNKGKIYTNGICPECHRKAKKGKRKGVNVKAYKEAQDAFKKQAEEYNNQHPIIDISLLVLGFKRVGII